MGRIIANVSITNLLDRQAGLRCNALVDTGAAHMVLPSASYAVLARHREDTRCPAPGAYRAEDFPGCESFHLPASEIDHYEGRLEFWDGDTETAWKVREPTSLQHEGPSRRLVRIATRVAALRGSRIVCFGSADLVRRDAAGRKRWLMQAGDARGGFDACVRGPILLTRFFVKACHFSRVMDNCSPDGRRGDSGSIPSELGPR